MKIRWKFFLALFTGIISINAYYFYVFRYTLIEPSNPSANESITPTLGASKLPDTSSKTAPSSVVMDVITYLVNNFEQTDLGKLLDSRYIKPGAESDPLWATSKNSYYTKTETGNLLGAKANTNHDHNSLYYSKTESNTLLDTKANTTGLSNYYTKTEVDSALSGKSASTHDHDDKYFTETETTALLANKSDTTHAHDDRYYTKAETTTQIQSNTALGGYSSVLPIQRNYVYIDQMESGWSSFYGNGTISYDTSDYKSGTSSVKVVTSNNATNSGARKTLSGTQDWSGKFIKIWVKVDNWSNINEVRLLVSTNGQFVDHFQASIRPLLTTPTDWNNQWIEFIIPTSHFTSVGSPNWSTVNQLIVRGIGNSGTTPSIWFDEYGVISNSSRSMLSITFDDGHSSDYTLARQVMESKGYKGNLFIIPSYLGTNGYMTQTQVDTMHNSGWEISGHGETNLTTLSAADQESNLSSTKQYLQSHGYRGAEIFAYPNGGVNPSIMTLTQKYYSLARTIVNTNQPISYMNPMTIHSRIVHDYDSTATVQGWIDSAIANKEWLILTFHRITPTAPSSSIEYLQSNFQTIVNYASSSGIEVLPMSQAMRRMQSF
ncbi:polysaccharide deacetylase family protein [candidate division WWE3 bacterium]|nr:polysaccharide deacetylase family protein [candidate division WWE3 bacterium]